MTDARPNIVLIITDHHAYYAHEREGEFGFKPPVFEAFCREGVRFDRAYSVSPVSSPARASPPTGGQPLPARRRAGACFGRIGARPQSTVPVARACSQRVVPRSEVPVLEQIHCRPIHHRVLGE